MSFSLSEVAQDFDWPIEFSMPVAGGTFAKKIFVGRFKIMESEQVDGYRGIGSASEDEKFASTVLIGWNADDVLDENGQPVEFSQEALAQIVRIPYLRSGIIQSYFDAMSGRAREKN